MVLYDLSKGNWKDALIDGGSALIPGVPAGVTKLKNVGRYGKQKRLKQILCDSKTSSADKGWIRQELNQIARGKRTSVRVPPGKNLAHRRGYEAKKGYGYEHSDLQDSDLHQLQHKHEGY